MLPAILTIILVLLILALLPYDRPSAPIFDEDDADDGLKLRMKPTRQR